MELRAAANSFSRPGAQTCVGQPSININWGIIMSLIKWQPFGELDDAFNRLMPSLFSRFPRFEFRQ